MCVLYLSQVSQQTIQWTEAKVAAALTGIRRRLASLYRHSKRYSLGLGQENLILLLGTEIVGLNFLIETLYLWIADSLCLCVPHRHCEVKVQVPLPRGPWSEIGGAGLTEFLLEEWLLKPLQALTSLRPLAELYRLKRRSMESPFNCESFFSTKYILAVKHAAV